MTSHACKQVGFDERIYGNPIHFDLGTIHVEPEVLKYLETHGVLLGELLAKHERLLPSDAMESTDFYQNLAAAPKKRMVLSVYRVGDQLVWIESINGHTQTNVKFWYRPNDLLSPTNTSLKSGFRSLFH